MNWVSWKAVLSFGSAIDIYFGLLLYNLELVPLWIKTLSAYVGLFTSSVSFLMLFFVVRHPEYGCEDEPKEEK